MCIKNEDETISSSTLQLKQKTKKKDFEWIERFELSQSEWKSEVLTLILYPQFVGVARHDLTLSSSQN